MLCNSAVQHFHVVLGTWVMNVGALFDSDENADSIAAAAMIAAKKHKSSNHNVSSGSS